MLCWNQPPGETCLKDKLCLENLKSENEGAQPGAVVAGEGAPVDLHHFITFSISTGGNSESN